MVSYRYHAIFDDGRRCQSCCNRSQIFGSRDIVSGWCSDCSECNVRWYRAGFNQQLRCVNHQMWRMVTQANLFSAGAEGTTLIYRCLGLCPLFERIGRITKHRLDLLESTLISKHRLDLLDSDDDSYYSSEFDDALENDPFAHFANTCLSKGMKRQLLRGLPRRMLSVLDAIVMNLVKLPSRSACRTFQSKDYTFEDCWRMYRWEEQYWMYNSMTREWFYTAAPAPWTAYRSYKETVWWLNGRRWFCEDCWRMYRWEERYWMYNVGTSEWFYTAAPTPWIAYRSYKETVWWLNGRRWFWG